jgi:hypothetical protein
LCVLDQDVCDEFQNYRGPLRLVCPAGFQQTSLEFDHGALLESMHLSIVRALWLSVYWLVPRVELLVALQALAMGATAWGAIRLAREAEDENHFLVVVMVLLCPFFPVLATADLRPLVFLVPASLWVMVGLREGRSWWVLLAALLALSAREEAPYVLLALIPWALWEERDRKNWLPVSVLGGVALSGWMAMELLWPGADNIRTTLDPGAVLQAISDGQRPLFRWEQEWQFALIAALASFPAFRCPVLLAPGLVAWLYLAIFSDFEPMAPGNGGLHYLAVIAPFWIGALARGVRSLQSSGLLTGYRAQLAWGLALICAAPHWIQCVEWSASVFERPDAGPRAMVAEVRSSTGGVLADPRTAPMLSGRSVLRIQGHFQVDRERALEVSEEVEWALLPQAAPAGEAGAAEWAIWTNALPAAGLVLLREEEGWMLWGRDH